jgi:hypothetical protein
VSLANGPGAGHLNRSAYGAVIMGMTKRSADRSRRAPGDGKRICRVAVRYTPSEVAQVEAAAAREGLVTAAWLGSVGLALSDPHGRPAVRASQEELSDLVDATEKVRRVGVLLNQVVRTMHVTGQVNTTIEYIAVKVWERVQRLDDAAVVVAGAAVKARRHR